MKWWLLFMGSLLILGLWFMVYYLDISVAADRYIATKRPYDLWLYFGAIAMIAVGFTGGSALILVAVRRGNTDFPEMKVAVYFIFVLAIVIAFHRIATSKAAPVTVWQTDGVIVFHPRPDYQLSLLMQAELTNGQTPTKLKIVNVSNPAVFLEAWPAPEEYTKPEGWPEIYLIHISVLPAGLYEFENASDKGSVSLRYVDRIELIPLKTGAFKFMIGWLTTGAWLLSLALMGIMFPPTHPSERPTIH